MRLGKIGFCCKWLDDPAETANMKINARNRELNTSTTTVAWLNRQPREAAEQRLWDIMQHNLQATYRLVERVGGLDERLRMCRIGSDILPVYTEPSWRYYWQQADIRSHCEREFARVGELARDLGVRLSFHPGQFCVLASDRPDVVERSIEEFEYHVDMARWMGYGKDWHDHGFKINVHISGRQGHEGIRRVLPRLSTEARNLITIENEENSHGLDEILALADCVALVLDLHHHWCREGDYVERHDPRVQRVIDSWRGVRPVLHYSVSREDQLPDWCPDTRPHFQQLIGQGHKKAHLRAHSDFMWNRAVNGYVRDFADAFDIQVESKAKNLASHALLAEWAC
jgi:UV DNA damage endonuclease